MWLLGFGYSPIIEIYNRNHDDNKNKNVFDWKDKNKNIKINLFLK